MANTRQAYDRRRPTTWVNGLWTDDRRRMDRRKRLHGTADDRAQPTRAGRGEPMQIRRGDLGFGGDRRAC